MKKFSALLFIFLLFSCSYEKFLSKMNTQQQNRYKFKKEFILGSWIGKNVNCNGTYNDQELIITFEGSDWVAKKVKPDACGPVIFRGPAPSSWDSKSTYTAKYTKSPTWQVDANINVKDIDNMKTDQGANFERKSKGNLNLYDSQWDKNYWLGDWECSGYECGPNAYTELVNITYEGTQFVGTKKDARGDMCVRTGKKTFWGERPDYLDTENVIKTRWSVGRASNPESSEVGGNCYIKTTEKFVCDEITCIRSSPYQKLAPSPAPIVGGSTIISGQPQIIQGQPQIIQGPPKIIQGQPQYIQGQPQYIYGQPQYMYGQPQYIQGQPQYIQGQPQYIQGQPQTINVQPQYYTGAILPGQNIQYVNGKPVTVPVQNIKVVGSKPK